MRYRTRSAARGDDMSDNIETIHVIFGHSIAETLREALPLLGSMERVIGLPDMLSVGPIDPPDRELRRDWARSVLRVAATPSDERGVVSHEGEQAWATATAPGIAPVFWACLSSPAEHACFLAFAARMEGRPFDLVDATDLDFSTIGGVRSPSSLGWLRAQDILAADLYARRRPVSLDERRTASEAWSRLRRENAPFRIVRDGRLVSAPLTHYDALLVEQARPEWEIAIRLIGRVVTTFHGAPTGDGTDGDLLFGRMLTLGEDRLLEVAGPGPGMRDYQVRRPRP